MNYQNPWQSYRQVSTKTAPPGQLVVMLYDGAIRFLECALSGFAFEDPLEFNSTISNNIVRAQAILTELNSSLDMERGGEISTTLRSLYHYMDAKLTQSNLRKTREGIEESIKHLTVLRDAWREMLAGAGREEVSANMSLSACG
jgi:flagellar protein FliS